MRHVEAPPLIEETNVWIPGADGIRLAARIWRPLDETPVPAILKYSPYRKRDGTVARDTTTHPHLVRHGYAAVRVDIRGSGESDGVLTDEYLQSELDDGVAIIGWIAAQPWCDGNVGMVGISWGGFNGLQIAALQPEPLKAVVTLCSTDDRYADDIHRMGGAVLCDELSWSAVMFAYNTLPPDPELVGDRWYEMWMQRLEGSGLWLAEWLRHQRRDDFFRHGSVCEDYSAIRVPVYAVSGWADGYSNAVFRLLEHLQVPRKGLIGPWVHAYPHLGRPGPAIDFVDEMVRWWDQWLKGKDTGIMDEPMLRTWMQDPVAPAPAYEYRPGRWVAEPAWPSPNVAHRTLGLSPDGRLSEPSEGQVTVSTPLWVGRQAGKWCAYDHGPDQPPDQRTDDAGSVMFDSPPLDGPVEILGPPVADLTVRSDRPIAQLAVRLCAVDPDGTSSRVTYGVLNLTHRDSHAEPTPLVPGDWYRVRVTLNHVAQRFEAGQRIRLALSSSYWPLMWPAPEPTRIELDCAASALQLPIRNATELDSELSSFGEPTGTTPTPRTVLEPASASVRSCHDLGTDIYEVEVVDDSGRIRFDDIDMITEDRVVERYVVTGSDPTSACGEIVTTVARERGDWRVDSETRTSLRVTAEAFVLDAALSARLNRSEAFRRTWHIEIPRDLV
ncbi:MAG: CocE/NonD family hydrolase [Acidimicrobiia bacterium]